MPETISCLPGRDFRPAAPATAEAPRDVVFTFSYVSWAGAQLRGMCFAQDRLAQTLLDDPRVARLLVCNLPRSRPVKLVKDALRPGPEFPASDSARLHEPLRLRRQDPRSIRALERWYRLYDRRLRRAALRFGMQRPAVITAHPLIAGFPELSWAGPVTFYATDDWAAYPRGKAWWPAYEESYARVRKSGRGVCAVSDTIVQRIRPSGPSIVVPNGIQPAEWVDPGRPPEWFLALPRPRLLYVGTLDSRLDIAGLRRVAAAYPDGSVVLVGRSYDDPHLAPLSQHANVHVRPAVKRPEVAAIVSAADACLLPHRRTALTEAMSPLKVYEYLAGGRPVAATDLPPVRNISNRLVLEPESGDFPGAVKRALALGPAGEAERMDFVSAHSWQRRHRQILDFALR